jgi:hypothetical protein
MMPPSQNENKQGMKKGTRGGTLSSSSPWMTKAKAKAKTKASYNPKKRTPPMQLQQDSVVASGHLSMDNGNRQTLSEFSYQAVQTQWEGVEEEDNNNNGPATTTMTTTTDRR